MASLRNRRLPKPGFSGLCLLLGLSGGLGWATLVLTAAKPAFVFKSGLALVAALAAQGGAALAKFESAQLHIGLLRWPYAVLQGAIAEGRGPAFARPGVDIDSFASTDLEDLLMFACDLFEFLCQEHALLNAAFGSGLGLHLALGGAAGLYAFQRITSSRRHKSSL